MKCMEANKIWEGMTAGADTAFRLFMEHVDCLENCTQCELKCNRILFEKPENKSPENTVVWEQISNPSISFAVICRDEEKYIGRCLKNIDEEMDESDELLIVDNGSCDRTLDIVKGYNKCRLICTVWENDFSKLRNLAVDNASKNWLFFIDADEKLEEGSIQKLKTHLKILEYLQIKHVVLSPVIINFNNHILREVKRIFRRDSGIKYFGMIHEDTRLDISMLGKDIVQLFMDDVSLYHDGYRLENIKARHKADRNIELLRKMVELEPENPRWKYFLCRDGRGMINQEDYEKLLHETVSLSGDSIFFQRYKVRALSDLSGYCIDTMRIDDAEKFLMQLDKLNPELSDIVYYRYYIEYIKQKKRTADLLNQLVEYRSGKTTIEFGGIHSNYFHIEFLISLLLFDVGEYKKTFEILKFFQNLEYGDYRPMYRELYRCLSEFLNEEADLE